MSTSVDLKQSVGDRVIFFFSTYYSEYNVNVLREVGRHLGYSSQLFNNSLDAKLHLWEWGYRHTAREKKELNRYLPTQHDMIVSQNSGRRPRPL